MNTQARWHIAEADKLSGELIISLLYFLVLSFFLCKQVKNESYQNPNLMASHQGPACNF